MNPVLGLTHGVAQKMNPVRMIDSEGKIENADTKKFLQGFVHQYVAWVKRFRK
jgi:hypothetical protein